MMAVTPTAIDKHIITGVIDGDSTVLQEVRLTASEVTCVGISHRKIEKKKTIKII